ncbi:MAG: ABC transporter ATP-binding protein [Candidatus Hodarchaeales archaeon]|jgi:putative ABC transport system ATP-binding protein
MATKVFTAGIIDKPLRSINRDLSNKITKDFRKSLKTSKKFINQQELNTFLLLSGETNTRDGFDGFIENVEKGRVYNRFREYYKNNESKLRKLLRSNQELRETSHIVLDFLKEIDPSFTKEFKSRSKQINHDLPTSLCELSNKTFITLWEFDEEKYRFFLSGFDFPLFTGSTTDTFMKMKVGELVDELIILNFIVVFLKPTMDRLHKMETVLEKLSQLVLDKEHYKTSNRKLQKKAELFFRILVAKLSALSELEQLIYRIFNLFEIPKTLISQYNLKSDFLDLNAVLTRFADQIEEGKSILHEVSDKIQKCQICLRDYMDEGINGVKLLDTEEFKIALKPIAELSVELFVEAELLKKWLDYFGSDIPHYSFNTQLFKTQKDEEITVEKDIIIAVRGLFKNYKLGRTTVYAIRGISLDIKEGEFVAIIGNSGAGKTTLLNCMASLDTPDHGTVIFRGDNLHMMKDSEKSRLRLLEMGFIFQSYALLPHYNTRENVALPADLAGLSKELKDRIEDLLKGVGIKEQALQYPAQLSGGQMQRVAIARALTNQPAVIFADEPTGDLDSVTGKQVMELLKKFHEETKTTVIVITHEDDIARYAQRQIHMEDGIITKRK